MGIEASAAGRAQGEQDAALNQQILRAWLNRMDEENLNEPATKKDIHDSEKRILDTVCFVLIVLFIILFFAILMGPRL